MVLGTSSVQTNEGGGNDDGQDRRKKRVIVKGVT